jgi:hypothetical protein
MTKNKNKKSTINVTKNEKWSTEWKIVWEQFGEKEGAEKALENPSRSSHYILIPFKPWFPRRSALLRYFDESLGGAYNSVETGAKRGHDHEKEDYRRLRRGGG